MEKTDLTDAFWADVQKAVPNLPDDYRVRRASGNPKFAKIIMDLILTEKKRGLFGLKDLQDRQPEQVPVMGGVMVLVDYDGIPQGAVQTVKITPVAYKDINDEHLAVEGPDARKLEVWQKIHWPYWTQMLEPYGIEPSEDMIVVVEEFKLIQTA